MPKAPFLAGPRLLFFSGGSALKGLCQALKRLNHNSIHLITPFDSGGSSAKLRQAFAMPAVGDLRSRILDLTNPKLPGQAQLQSFLDQRLALHKDARELHAELIALASINQRPMKALEAQRRDALRQYLETFLAAMPTDFDLRGASIGNLVLAGAYLEGGRRLGASVRILSDLVETRGEVRCMVEAALHLGAELADGRVILGQHLLTGKEAPVIDAPIKCLWLNASLTEIEPISCPIDEEVRDLIASADLICYPPGSFHSSLLANLLPQGVGQAIASNPCPKVYIPNLGPDPEQLGLDLVAQVGRLLEYLRRDAPGVEVSELLNWVLLDSKRGQYQGAIDKDGLEALGCRILDKPLVSDKDPAYYYGAALVEALYAMAA